MFGEEWEPAEGELIDIRYGGKHGVTGQEMAL